MNKNLVGFIYNANGNPQEVYSLAPARQTNFGRIEKVTGILLTGNTPAGAQAEANALSGLYRAWKNIRFPHIRILTYNNRFLEPATQDYFAVTLPDTIRDLNWDKKEFLTAGVSISFDNETGILLVEVEGEASTWGPDGVAGNYPHDDYDDPTDGLASIPETPPEEPSEYFPPGGIPDDEMGGLIFFLGQGNNKVYRSYNILDPSATVVYEDLGALPVGVGIVRWIAVDPFSPTTTAMVCGTEGTYIATDMDCVLPATPTWNLVMPAAGTWDHIQVVPSKLVAGRWMIPAVIQGACPWGGTYTPQLILIDNYIVSGGVAFSDFWLGNCDTYDTMRAEFSTHAPDRCWFLWYNGTWGMDVCETEDWWATWIQNDVAALIWDEFRCLHHRHLDNDDDDFALWGHGLTAAFPNGRAYITRCLQDIGTCNTWTSPDNDGDQTHLIGSPMWVAKQYWALTGPRTGYPASFKFFISNNGTVWTEQHDFNPLVVRHIVDWPVDGNRFYATCDGGPIMVSTDRGVNWTNKLGNWGAVGGGAGTICCADVAKPVRWLP